MNKIQVRTKLAGMVKSLEVIISNASEQTRELKELIRFKNELEKTVREIDNGWDISLPVIVRLVREVAIALYVFLSQ